MSLATSCDITRHHAIGSGSGSGAGGVRRHSSEGVAEEGRGGGSGSGSGRRVGIGSVRGSPYNLIRCIGWRFRATYHVLKREHLRRSISTQHGYSGPNWRRPRSHSCPETRQFSVKRWTVFTNDGNRIFAIPPISISIHLCMFQQGAFFFTLSESNLFINVLNCLGSPHQYHQM